MHAFLTRSVCDLAGQDPEERLQNRYERYRQIGEFAEA